MSEQQSTGSLGLPPAAWFALLLGIAGVFAISQKPFQDSRPDTVIASRQAPPGVKSEDIEARPWEDPFFAIESVRRAHADGFDPCATSTPKIEAAQRSNTLLMGVMVSGDPYAEDIESRRRARYAVLSGLYRLGFVPIDHDHIGCAFLVSSDSKHNPAHSTVAYEWFKSDAAQQGAAAPQVLLVWLDEEGFRDSPLKRLSEVFSSTTTTFDSSNTVVLGPGDSDGLRAIHDEIKRADPGGKWTKAVHAMTLFSSRATASEESILGEVRGSSNSLAKEVSETKTGVELLRAVANDSQVATAVMDELKSRGIQPSEIALVYERDTLYARGMGTYFGDCANQPRPTADISQPKQDSDRVLCFTYLRGLDSPIPATAGSDSSASKTAHAGAAEESGARSESGTKSDSAIGQSQLDYLRRLADTIVRARDQEQCSSGPTECKPRRIRAIGVISSDVYDKLLILQALREALPSVTFFTFDLDARLLEPRSLKWTRQLIVGSSLGLSLDPRIQGDIPPFRDTYQTSTFFSTLLAVHRFMQRLAPAQSDTATGSAAAAASETMEPSSRGLGWTIHPRVFEIGRRQAFDITTRTLDQNSRGRELNCDWDAECLTIAPPVPEGIWRPTAFWYERAGVGIAVGIALMLASLIALGTRSVVGRSRRHHLPFAGPRHWNNGIVALIVFIIIVIVVTLAWPLLIDRLTGNGSQVAPPFSSGANQWTPSIIDMLSIATVIILVTRGQRKLHDNAENMRREFGFPMTSRQLVQWHRASMKQFSRPVRLLNALWLPVRPLPRRFGSGLANERVSPLEAIIAQYLYRGTPWNRALRVLIGTLVVVIALVILEAIPGTAVARQFSLFEDHFSQRWWLDLISMLSLVAMQFLILWTADAMLLSRSFLLAVLRDQPAWPQAALGQQCWNLALAPSLATLWLNMRLIARRTVWVSNLIWYPSLVIAAMAVVTFSTQFGDFQFANNPIALVASTLVVVGCAVALRHTAERWRHAVLRDLEDKRLREHLNLDDRPVKQLDGLLERVKSLDEGAFAPYSEQPIVRAVLLPALTYGATILSQYLHPG